MTARAKKKINSRTKGKTGELELAEFLRAQGFDNSRRGQQFKGGPGSADVVGLPEGYHVECKRVEAGNLYTWLAQAKRDGGKGAVPIVAHRRNRQDWVAILPLESLLALIRW